MERRNVEIAEYVEAVSLPDVWFDGIQRIEPLSGGCVRFILYRQRVDDYGRAFREPVANLVCASQIVPDCAYRSLSEVAQIERNGTSPKVLAS